MARLRLTVYQNIPLVKKIARALSDFYTKIVGDDRIRPLISSGNRFDPIDRIGSINPDGSKPTRISGRALVMEDASNLILSINIRSSSESYYVAL
jgi:hypothetical protein